MQVAEGLVKLGVMAPGAEADVGQPDGQPAVPAHSGTSPSGGAAAEEKEKVVPREELKDEGRLRTPHTPLRIGAPPSGSREEARVRVCLARLQMEAEERAAERQHRLRMRRVELEIEAEKAVRTRQMERRGDVPAPSKITGPQTPDISKYVAVPTHSFSWLREKGRP